MPLDPNIILGIKPAQIQMQDPLEQYGKSLTLKNLMLQNHAAEQGAQDETAQREALISSAGDNARYRELLSGRGQYKAVQALDKFNLENKKTAAEIASHEASAAKAKYETEIGKIEHVSSILSTAKDQPSWDNARRVMALSFPGSEKNLPEQFDPSVIQAHIAQGQTIAQRLTDQRAQEQATETARSHKANEANAAGTLAENTRHNKQTEQDTWQHIETPDGVVAFNPRTRQTVPLMGADGKPIQGGKGLNESQGKAAGMAMRAQTAHDLLSDLEAAGTKTPGLIKQGVGGVPFVGGALAMGVNALPTWAGGPSGSQQQVEQAQRDFVNAALRVESGASINDSEFENARKQYFTQPGDSPAAIEQKRRNRETEIESLKMQAGPLAKKALAEAKIAADDRRKKPPPMGGSDMAKGAPATDVAKLSDADLLKALGMPSR